MVANTCALSAFSRRRSTCPLAGIFILLLASSFARAQTVSIPFDFSRSSIGLDVTVKGTALYVILDTGVDPSVIDLALADALGLKVDRHHGSEASGFGDAKGAQVFPTSIDQLEISGRSFPPFDALASDMTGLSTQYGRKLDGVLGYSFLSDKIVLIDYIQRTVGILDRVADATATVKMCRTHWTTPLRTFENFPIIADFRFGAAKGRVTLDTGSNGNIALYQSALYLRGVRAALSEKSTITFAGARGSGNANSYKFSAPIGFGPFTLPAGQTVTVRTEKGSTDTRVANVGNALLAAMKLKALLNYRSRSITFHGNCQ